MPVFASDTFSDSPTLSSPNRIPLSSHTSDSGHAWNANSDFEILTDDGNVGVNSGNLVPSYAAIQSTPPSADYRVTADFTVTVTSLAANTSCGVLCRANSEVGTSASGYFARMNVDGGTLTLGLERLVSNDYTNLVSPVSVDFGTAPKTVNVGVEAEGDQISLLLDGAVIGTVTDTAFTEAGLASLSIRSQGNEAAIPYLVADNFVAETLGGTLPTLRKSSTFDIETELSGTVTDATLDGNAITVDSQDGTTVTLTDSDGSITTSGEYDLVLTDDSADPDETITVQVDVYGVVPSDNPWQKDGSALTDLTDVQYRVVAGADLNGNELFYTATGATDASGNIPTFDVSDSAAEVDDTVHIVGLTANGESIVATETVELI